MPTSAGGVSEGWHERVGIAGAGTYRGMFVEVEPDASRSGWHIWLSWRDPRLGVSDGWDIWADERDDVEEWLGPANLAVVWIN